MKKLSDITDIAEIKDNRTKNAFMNFLSSILFQITATVAGFIIPMFLLKIYGSEIFGFSTSVMAVVAGINLLEIGLGSGLIQALYKPIHEGDTTQVNGILARSQNYYLKSGIVIFISSLFIALLYSLSNNQGTDFFTLLSLSATLLLGSVFEYIFIGKYRVLLTADEKVGVLVNIQTGAMVISSAIRITLMLLGFGIVFMQIIATSVYVLRAIVISLYVRHKYPQATYGGERSSLKIENTSVVFHNISNLVVLNTPFLLLIVFTNLAITSVFAVYAIVFNAISSILYATFSQAAVASFGKVAAKGEKKALRESFSLYEFIFMIVLFVAYATTASLITDFVKLYTQGISNVNFFLPFISILFTASGLLFSFRYPLITMIQADGHFKETKNSVIIEMILMVSVSVLGVIFLGLYGVFIGMIASAIYRAIHLVWYVNLKILSQSAFISIRRLIVNCFTVVGVLTFLNVNKIFVVNSWFDLIVSGVLQGLLIFAVFGIINFFIEPKMIRTIFYLAKRIVRK